ncbi:DUF4199 domain-containing protein [Mangrovivirga sp. M17]|uniref:DUF4199 domain-containing protein n=1 Tax=Mangrovivirga halotolerans TaxID=2993936 RepID=A0ABT3RX78_9BACT|nr:DUF4199 domain-containing protein [Mangrovivirga halotolerans]MCX2745974.1 DUF4199 domain-containing protein [Mangrovivirga halotolerans]
MKDTFISEGVKDGVIIGLIFTLLTVIIYVVDINFFGGLWYGLGVFVLYLILLIIFNSRFRNGIGGYWSFGEAFKYNFFLLLTGGIINTIVGILLFVVIDPNASQIIAENAVENTISIVEKMGGDVSEIEGQLDETYDNTIEQFTLAGQLKSFGIAILVYAVIGAIFAAIFKKKKPQEEYI